MRRIVALIVLAAFLLAFVGCSMHTHVVGKGAQQGVKMQQRQWYFLWGLIPLNDANSATMAAGAPDYTIKTEQSALDVILNMFTSMVTVYSRTVTVTK